MTGSLPITALLLGASLLLPPLAPQNRQDTARTADWETEAQTALRAETPEGRETAAFASDLTLASSLAAGAAAVGVHSISGNESDRFALGAVQALALNSAATFLTKRLAGRIRPDSAIDDPNPDSAQSFFSGHASFAFLGAAVACRATQWPGQATPDWICPAALATAAATAWLRVRANRHFLTDVLVGSIVGTASGLWLVPSAPSQDTESRPNAGAPAFQLVFPF